VVTFAELLWAARMVKRQREEIEEEGGSASSPLGSLGSQNAFGYGEGCSGKKPRLSGHPRRESSPTAARSSVRVGSQEERTSDDSWQLCVPLTPSGFPVVWVGAGLTRQRERSPFFIA